MTRQDVIDAMQRLAVRPNIDPHALATAYVEHVATTGERMDVEVFAAIMDYA